MSPDEKAEFIEGLGIGQSRSGSADYGVLSAAGADFLPDGRRRRVPRMDDCKGTKAPQAAGKIHS